jgi:hypothetical protein
MNINAMYRIVVVAAVLAFCSTFAAKAVAAPVSQHVTVTGYVSCTTCLMPNTCKAQTRLACTEWWVNQGAGYVLVVGDTHYLLSGFENELAKAAAENSVTVTGDLDGRNLAITAIESGHSTK